MWTIALPFETWRAVIETLRAKALPDMLEHASHLERQLDQHPADEPMVSLDLNHDLYHRSFNWARLELGLPLPPAEER